MSTLRVAVLLIATSGFLDSLAYVAYGHVFTNAQTGNIVLVGVSAVQGDWPQALRFIPPMLAFFPGIFAAQWLRRSVFPGNQLGASTAALCIELALLAACGLLSPVLPDQAVAFALAFTAALQNSAFQKVGQWSYTSVVTTGNLRSLGEAFFSGVFPHRYPEMAGQARVMAAICASFAGGAAGGAALTTMLGQAAIVFPIVLLLLALAAGLAEARVPSRA